MTPDLREWCSKEKILKLHNAPVAYPTLNTSVHISGPKVCINEGKKEKHDRSSFPLKNVLS